MLLSWMREPKTASFEDVILEVHEFQLRTNPVYARYCAMFPSASHWAAIPALPQRLFKEFAIRSFPAEKTAHTFRTSGTTGEGYGEHHFQSLRLYREAAISGWNSLGLGARRVLALMAPASEAPHSSLSQMASWLCEDDSAFFVRGGRAEWERLSEALSQSTTPFVIFGTALAFLDWMEHRDRSLLPTGAILIETGGYKGSGREISKADLYAQMADHFSVAPADILNEYGMTELSSQFYARGPGAVHRSPPWARAVVIDPETGLEVPDGETGVLRLFDAANLWSVCAVQTQDLAIRRGADFELIGRDPAALPRGCSRAADEMLRHS